MAIHAEFEIYVNRRHPVTLSVLPFATFPRPKWGSQILDRVSYIPENNLLPLCQIIADLAQYRFDDWDSSAVASGINGTDNENGLRFEYPLEGVDMIRLSIARETGTATVHLQVTFPDHLIGRVETALDIASAYGLSTNRWGKRCGEEA